MRILTVLTLCLVIFSAVNGRNNNSTADNPVYTYVDKYKQIAISEMQRVGIPASIKLAQGILESNSGRSTLALKANNHFGIKCGNYWDGDTFYREDDDYKNGKLIESCFRKFDNSQQSYIEHSNFLTNPGSQYRYGFLFELDIMNYTAWARGLKKSGYASDPTYAEKLISIIEKYELYMYDTGIPVETEPVILAEVDAEPQIEKSKKNHGDRRQAVMQFKVEDNFHVVKQGETMAMIAKKFNIDEDLFYFQNRIPNGSQPVEGERLKIQGYFHWGKKPQVEKAKKKSKAPTQYLFRDDEVSLTVH